MLEIALLVSIAKPAKAAQLQATMNVILVTTVLMEQALKDNVLQVIIEQAREEYRRLIVLLVWLAISVPVEEQLLLSVLKDFIV